MITGCNGAWTYSYLKTTADSGLGLTHESTYPYLNKSPKLTCPSGLEAYNQGAKVSDGGNDADLTSPSVQVTGQYYTYSGDEDLLEKLVAEHGAAVSSVNTDPWNNYAV